MAEVFTILDNGEELITGEWIPPPDELAARLVALANSLDNMSIPMEEARQLAIQTTREHFQYEEDPQKVGWEPLTKDWIYDKRKVNSAFPDVILKMTGAGYEAATSEEAYFVTENEIWFKPGLNDTGYMAYHQRGLEMAKISSTGPGPLSGSQIKALTEGSGRGRLPKREFIGFDDYDIGAIEAIFNAWFAENLNIIGGGGGGGLEFGHNMLGEFPIISYSKIGQPIIRTPFGPRFGSIR